MTRNEPLTVTTLSRTAVAALFLLCGFVTVHFSSQAFAQQPPAPPPQEDSDSKGDVSTENNANIGQMKDEKLIQEQKETDRNTEKKDPGTSRDQASSMGRNDARPERPQRFERPMRPERPHR